MGSKKGAPRLKFTKDVYAALLVAFRLKPGDMQHAGEAAGMSSAQAGRVWRGDPALLATHPWVEPIEQVLAKEGETAIALLKIPIEYRHKPGQIPSARKLAAMAEIEAAQKAEELEAERAEYLAAMVAERRLVTSSQRSTQAGWDEMELLEPAMAELARRISSEIVGRTDISIREGLAALKTFNEMRAHLVGCSKANQSMTRLDRGVSTENVAVRIGADMTPEEADEILASAAAAASSHNLELAPAVRTPDEIVADVEGADDEPES